MFSRRDYCKKLSHLSQESLDLPPDSDKQASHMRRRLHARPRANGELQQVQDERFKAPN